MGHARREPSMSDLLLSFYKAWPEQQVSLAVAAYFLNCGTGVLTTPAARLCNAGLLERVGHGVYCAAAAKPPEEPSVVSRLEHHVRAWLQSRTRPVTTEQVRNSLRKQNMHLVYGPGAIHVVMKKLRAEGVVELTETGKWRPVKEER